MVINNLEKVTEQYQSSENLSIRTNFHEIYSTNKINFFDFLFERYDFKKNSGLSRKVCKYFFNMLTLSEVAYLTNQSYR